MKKKIYLGLALIILSVLLIFTWIGKKEESKFDYILSNKSATEKVIVRDANSEQIILEVSEEDAIFEGIVDNIYRTFGELNWFEKRKTNKIGSLYKMEFKVPEDESFWIDIYRIDSDLLSILPEDEQTDIMTITYKYSPTYQDEHYILVVEELNHILMFPEAFHLLIDKIENN